MVKRKRSTSRLEEITEDGILCSIISSLRLRDAIRTSVLSCRWRHIWTQIPNLDFDATNMLGNDIVQSSIHHLDMKQANALLMERTEKFIRSVDAVLQHHQRTGVEAFRVNYVLRKKHSHYLDRWVSFGITSKTKELVLNLAAGPCVPFSTDELYDFPCQFFTGRRGSCIEHLCMNCCSLKPPPKFDGFNYLKALDLDNVAVTEEDVENFISNCFLLERLSVERSQVLVNLKISHPLDRLIFLNVERCDQLRNIEFDAINLTTFKFAGYNVNMIFRGGLQLTKAYITLFSGWDTMGYALTRLPRNLPHLKTLFLSIVGELKVFGSPESFNRFIHLKHLVVISSTILDKRMDVLSFASLLNAAPFMEKFEFHLQRDTVTSGKRIRMLPKCPHYHLKTVEITGFNGSRCQTELAIYLLQNAIELELMTINRRARLYEEWDKWVFSKKRETPMRAIEYIRREVPSNVKLVIL